MTFWTASCAKHPSSASRGMYVVFRAFAHRTFDITHLFIFFLVSVLFALLCGCGCVPIHCASVLMRIPTQNLLDHSFFPFRIEPVALPPQPHFDKFLATRPKRAPGLPGSPEHLTHGLDQGLRKR